MEIIGVLAVIGLVAIFGGLILGLINQSAISGLRRAVERQSREIEALKRAAVVSPPAPAPQATAAVIAPAPVMAATPSVADMPLAAPPAQTPPPASPAAIAPMPPPPSVSPKPAAHKTLERQFGGRAFVWLGGIALALAGFFLVKYSIDTGLLTEGVRVILGLLFGIALLAGSDAVRRREKLADGARIAQALAGAGIADLYGSLFAATTLYHFLPSWLGFGLMAAVTAVALVLSLRHGAPIAALGLIGGYVTPLLIQGEPNAPVLFGYLYLVFGGLAFVIRRQNWAWLSIPATAVAFVWVLVWLLGGMAFKDGAWLSLFLAGIGATGALGDRSAPDAKRGDPQFWLRYLAPAGSLLLMACVTYATNFSGFEWAMFGLFSAGAIALAWFDDRRYVFAPWMALAVNLAMLLGWFQALPSNLAVVIAAFAALFVVSSQLVLTRSRNPLSWAGLGAAALLGYFLLAYGRLQPWFALMLGHNADAAWAAIAIAGAALAALAATQTFVVHAETALRHRLQAVYAATASALLAIGFAILLHQEFLSFAIAAQIVALCWINTRTDIPALRVIVQFGLGLFGLLLLPDIALILAPEQTAAAVFASDIWHQASGMFFRYALPAVMFTGASLLLRRQRDDAFVWIVEGSVIALAALTTYKLVEIAFVLHAQQSDLIVHSVYTDLLLLLSFAATRIAARFQRIAVLWGAVALAGLALARIVGFELLLENPLWSHQLIGVWPVVNGLLLAYGLPAAAGLVIAQNLDGKVGLAAAWPAKIAAYVLAFVYVTFSVRQFYAGAFLDSTAIGSAEIYTYSAVWLMFGVALLFAAVLRKDMTMRVASLVILLLSIGKVFLYDASALTGLLRVVSFLGLGLSLLGLSWFYTRFVFVGDKPTEPEAAL